MRINSGTFPASHNGCAVAQAGVKRGALVGHGKGAVGVGEVVEEGSTWVSNQYGQAGEDVTNSMQGEIMNY